MEFDHNQTNIKPPKTFKEQVELFRSRKMQVENSEFVEKTLQRINYYRLTAYALTLKNPSNKDEYISSSSFEHMLSLYEFDRRLRLLLMGVLETIEIAIRTHLSYEIAHKYGPLGYMKSENFSNKKFHRESMVELETLIQRSRKRELFIQHHFNKYDGILPVWAAFEVTSFGFVSKFYRNLKEDLKKHIAKVYYDIPSQYLESWLQTLSNVRNICAHYGRLYNRKLTFMPRLFKSDHKKFDNKHIFSAIYIADRLITKADGTRFSIDLEALISEYADYINFAHIGFPSDWLEILNNLNDKKDNL